MKQVVRGEVTLLLEAWARGDQAALDRLCPMIYEELRRLAQGQMRGERSSHTLQTTALVHEAFLRLKKQKKSIGRAGGISWPSLPG